MDESVWLIIGAIATPASMIICGYQADKKGYSTPLWVLLGFLGGLISVLFMAVPPDRKAQARSGEAMRLQEERDAVALERERLALERERRLLEEERQRLGRGDGT